MSSALVKNGSALYNDWGKAQVGASLRDTYQKPQAWKVIEVKVPEVKEGKSPEPPQRNTVIVQLGDMTEELYWSSMRGKQILRDARTGAPSANFKYEFTPPKGGTGRARR